jgi:hypothetical protein
MKVLLEFGGTFVAGFLACWFLSANIKCEILKLRSDLSNVISSAAKKV